MPCIVCGAPTEENSFICSACLQKEIHKNKKSVKKEPSAKSRQTPPPAAAKPKAKPAAPKKDNVDFDRLLGDLGKTLGGSEDLEVTSAPPASPKKPEEPALDLDSGQEMSLDMDDLFEKPQEDLPEINVTPAKNEGESISEYVDTDSLGGGTLSLDDTPELDLDAPAEEEVPTLDLDGAAPGLEPEGKADKDPEEILESSVSDVNETDEDILKKKIRNKLQQKLEVSEPEEKVASPVDNLLDEILLDEIDEIKKEGPQPKVKKAKSQPVKKAEAVPKVEKKKVKRPEPAKEKSNDELLKEILQPKKKSEDILTLGDSLREETKKKEEGIPGLNLKSDKLKTKPLFESSDSIIKGTTSKKEDMEEEYAEKKKGKGLLWFLLILLILGGGGYGAWQFYFKKDPIKVELLNKLQQAEQAQTAGNLQEAYAIYESIGPKYAKYSEAAVVSGKMEELKTLLQKQAETAKYQQKIAKLLKEGNSLFAKQRWVSGRGRNALTVYREILKLDPVNQEAKSKLDEMVNAYLKNGAQAMKNKSYKTAKSNFEKVLKIDPNNITASSSLEIIAAYEEQARNLQLEKERQRKAQLAAAQKEKERQAELARQAELERQKELEQQRKEEAAQKARAQEEAKKNSFKDKVLIEGLVDGGRRVYVKKVIPQMPLSARNAGIKGTVFVEVIVGNNGVPEQVRVVKSPHESLSQASVNAVKQFRYKPPTKNGDSCKMKLTEILQFK